jgi:hypothetical protein
MREHQMPKRGKVAWILGSGFSRSLGGPLLRDLLSDRRRQLVDAVFRNQDGKPTLPAERVVAYNVFHAFKEGRDQPGYWQDAEEFLDFVDVANDEKEPRRAMLEQLLRQRTQASSVEEVRDLAILSVASEVSTYTEVPNLRGESWQPYQRWKKQLVKQGDAIVTFNYDLVVERLSTNGESDLFGPHTVFTPYMHEDPSGVPIYKLHGSANWAFQERNPSAFQEYAHVGGFAGSDKKPLIASPGATKLRLCQGELQQIWQEAKKRICEADVIVFIGYRFPPSDSHARTEILGAIKANDAPYLRVHTVLGPNLNEPDSVRLSAMLHRTIRAGGKHEHETPDLPPNKEQAKSLPRYNVVQHPLYAEDFLSVVDDTELFTSNVSPLTNLRP